MTTITHSKQTRSMEQILARAVAPQDSGQPAPRAMLVFAHPDDETIALGARLGRIAGAHLVHVTDGAPRNEQDSHAYGFRSFLQYRAARFAELDTMLRQAGLQGMSRECLGVPDQQAALRLCWTARELAARIRSYRPEVVFTHPYEGGHPDHDACAFAVHKAVVLADAAAEEAPVIVECTSYHSGPGGIETGTFLPAETPVAELVFALSDEERRRKEALLACFPTQQNTLGPFRCDEERFRIAPEYDFTRPPHRAPVWYDHHPWGMTSARFCRLAQNALRTLGTFAEAA